MHDFFVGVAVVKFKIIDPVDIQLYDLLGVICGGEFGIDVSVKARDEHF